MSKNMLLSTGKPKISSIYLLSLALSLWGIGNVFYWEVYKGYSACTFCAWHRGVYITLFILLLGLFKYSKLFIKFLVWTALTIETLVSLMQVFEPCSPLTCKYVSLPEQLNLAFAVGTLILTLVFELKAYVQYRKKLSLQVKHTDNFPNIKIIYKSNACI